MPDVLLPLSVLCLVILLMIVILRRWKQPYLVAYILAGLVLGPQVAGVFKEPAAIETLGQRSRSASAHDVAMAYCQGTPLRTEIEARAPSGLETTTQRVSEALVRRFGNGVIEGGIRAHIVVAAVTHEISKVAERGRIVRPQHERLPPVRLCFNGIAHLAMS